jgi:hypothetical protein
MDSNRLIKQLKEEIIKNDLMVKSLIKVNIFLIINKITDIFLKS